MNIEQDKGLNESTSTTFTVLTNDPLLTRNFHVTSKVYIKINADEGSQRFPVNKKLEAQNKRTIHGLTLPEIFRGLKNAPWLPHRSTAVCASCF